MQSTLTHNQDRPLHRFVPRWGPELGPARAPKRVRRLSGGLGLVSFLGWAGLDNEGAGRLTEPKFWKLAFYGAKCDAGQWRQQSQKLPGTDQEKPGLGLKCEGMLGPGMGSKKFSLCSAACKAHLAVWQWPFSSKWCLLLAFSIFVHTYCIPLDAVPSNLELLRELSTKEDVGIASLFQWWG